MRSFELLKRRDEVELAICAHRMGVACGTPRFLAARLARPTPMAAFVRRARDVGAADLALACIHRGGALVPRSAHYEEDWARLAGWAPIAESPEGWVLPADLAVAGLASAERELFFASTLVARLPLALRTRLAEALGVDGRARPLDVSLAIAERLAACVTHDEITPLAHETARIGSVRADEIVSVDICVDRADAPVFTLTLTGDRTLRVLCRECATRLGAEFAPDPVNERVRPRGAPRRNRLPVSVRIGALVTFATVRATDEALREPDFRELVSHRVDERHVVLTPEANPDTVQRLLQRMGFGVAVPVES